MAMSDTGSSLAQQWAGLYTHDEPTMTAASGVPGEGGVGGAMSASPTTTSPAGSGGGSPTRAASVPGVEGPRIGKPARRRSRASRRAPVTLLNTDTTNFRAMVQQFTGIPAPAAGAAAFGGVPVISFGSDYNGFPTGGGVLPFSDHLQLPPRPAFQDHHHNLLRPQQQYTGGAAFGYGNLSSGGAGAGDVFGHALSSAEDRMLLQSLQSAQMPASTANHSANGYFA